MPDGDVASDYREREVEAVYSVLLELGQVLGAYRDKFVLVGGAVPWLLLPQAAPKHIGTLDVDLNLDPEALADGEYAALVTTLEDHGYERNVDGLRPFQLRRRVRVKDGGEISVLIDLLMPRNARTDSRKEKLLENFRVQGADGGEVALAHRVRHRLDGTMPDGRRNSVELLVASIPALLVMKGYALVGRDKKKDSYDIYFSVRNYPGGVEALIADCQPLLADPVARKAYEQIASKFRSRNDFGPATAKRFLEESEDWEGMTPDQILTDVYMQVSTWLRGIGLVQ